VFQEPPPELDATWTHGVLVGGMTLLDRFSIARAFRHAAEVLVDTALDSEMPYTLTYPIFYSYRHAIELYLKIVTDSTDIRHDFGYFADLLKKQHNMKLSKWAQDFIDQLEELDKKSTTFRYGERWPKAEVWVDLYQLKVVASVLCNELENLIVESGSL
jgi:hypothetical protein